MPLITLLISGEVSRLGRSLDASFNFIDKTRSAEPQPQPQPQPQDVLPTNDLGEPVISKIFNRKGILQTKPVVFVPSTKFATPWKPVSIIPQLILTPSLTNPEEALLDQNLLSRTGVLINQLNLLNQQQAFLARKNELLNPQFFYPGLQPDSLTQNALYNTQYPGLQNNQFVPNGLPTQPEIQPNQFIQNTFPNPKSLFTEFQANHFFQNGLGKQQFFNPGFQPNQPFQNGFLNPQIINPGLQPNQITPNTFSPAPQTTSNGLQNPQIFQSNQFYPNEVYQKLNPNEIPNPQYYTPGFSPQQNFNPVFQPNQIIQNPPVQLPLSPNLFSDRIDSIPNSQTFNPFLLLNQNLFPIQQTSFVPRLTDLSDNPFIPNQNTNFQNFLPNPNTNLCNALVNTLLLRQILFQTQNLNPFSNTFNTQTIDPIILQNIQSSLALSNLQYPNKLFPFQLNNSGIFLSPINPFPQIYNIFLRSIYLNSLRENQILVNQIQLANCL